MFCMESEKRAQWLRVLASLPGTVVQLLAPISDGSQTSLTVTPGESPVAV